MDHSAPRTSSRSGATRSTGPSAACRFGRSCRATRIPARASSRRPPSRYGRAAGRRASPARYDATGREVTVLIRRLLRRASLLAAASVLIGATLGVTPVRAFGLLWTVDSTGDAPDKSG